MTIQDYNLTLRPPQGFEPIACDAQGAYLRLEYRFLQADRTHFIVLFLNDSGREVLRVLSTQYLPQPGPRPPAPVSRRFRFKNGFLIALQGLGEMVKCLKS